MEPALIAVLVLAIVVIVVLVRTLRIIPQARAAVVERLGRYQRTLEPGTRVEVVKIEGATALVYE